jgi:hypothetical protein
VCIGASIATADESNRRTILTLDRSMAVYPAVEARKLAHAETVDIAVVPRG